MQLYGIPTCDTCRKALKALNEAGRDVTFVDVRKDGLPQGKAERFHEAFGPKIVNRRSTTWRQLSEAEREGEAVELIVAQPTLMKRPVIEDGEALYLGWTAETRAALRN
ncbi:ArsC/Spx/MgsR family protein [Palleronia sp.]|uniref:ArsC/Spx/MgsR family protein n=1 Tax=Palleronia sp. TaxID=1940284 RepID=UPI0035C7C963